MNKKILIIIAILVVFVLGFMVQNYLTEQKYAEAIREVIELIHKTPEVDNNASYETAKIKITAMEKIDLRQCPPDFQKAYFRYIKAWRSAKAFYFKIQHNQLSMSLSVLLDPITKMYGKETEMQKAQKIEMEGHDSWSEIKLIALKYGVQVGAE